jgi:predicted O-methyltransferase YrrM
MNYIFTPNTLWFNASELKSLVSNFLKKDCENHILEIGSYEGLSSVFFADNFLFNENSTLTCVDPFLSIDDNDHSELLLSNQEKNFLSNISNTSFSDKIIFEKKTSDVFFLENKKVFNFIYIDGSHESSQAVSDLDNSLKVITDGGIIWMDDYLGGSGIKPAVDEYISSKKRPLKLIHNGYQIAFQKI